MGGAGSKETRKPFEVGEGLILRDLEEADFDKGFLDVLKQLTTVGAISKEQFKKQFQFISNSPDYRIAVIEDQTKTRIAGTAALIVERKFIHECGMVGHIEDVVVLTDYRGKKLGQKLVVALAETSKELGCYKVILDCAEDNVMFYEKCGFERKEVQMVQYFSN
eukprot:TRINITY_DN18701_c0_g1_i1.p1 TRINITY_DN18701_c0_g1~~TRINITY_DN18701_c0_g1_i1.p1  ORF type:complete len:164 (+),score=23.55 TRINITY_DN18701_c0_g1_i1:71-562(+)